MCVLLLVRVQFSLIACVKNLSCSLLVKNICLVVTVRAIHSSVTGVSDGPSHTPPGVDVLEGQNMYLGCGN